MAKSPYRQLVMRQTHLPQKIAAQIDGQGKDAAWKIWTQKVVEGGTATLWVSGSQKRGPMLHRGVSSRLGASLLPEPSSPAGLLFSPSHFSLPTGALSGRAMQLFNKQIKNERTEDIGA